MKKIVTIITLLLVLVSLFAHRATNGWEKMKLKGQVKCLSTSPDGGEPPISYYFDEYGNITKDEQNMEGEINITLYSYSYDNAKRMIRLARSMNGNVYETESYMYNSEGTLVKSLLPATECVWDKNGNMINEIQYDDKKNIVIKKSYTYDEYGFRVKEVLFGSRGELLETTNFTNDEYGNPLTAKTYNKQGKMTNSVKHIYSYDEKGNVRVDKYNDMFDVAFEFGYEYEYYKSIEKADIEKP